MNLFKNITRCSLMIALLITFPFLIIAQPSDPCPDPNLPDCPIDSGVVFLVAAAFAVALKKAYDFKNSIKSA